MTKQEICDWPDPLHRRFMLFALIDFLHALHIYILRMDLKLQEKIYPVYCTFDFDHCHSFVFERKVFNVE